MALIVHKYGGTSMGSTERIRNVAKRVAKWARAGHQMVVVPSAMSGETNRLLGLAKELAPVKTDTAYDRELDMLAATGEQASSALLAIALQSEGMESVSYAGWQVPIKTNSAFTKARIESIDDVRVRKDLAAGRVVIVTGFQGVDPDGHITTLGRGGSDTSAVAVAAATPFASAALLQLHLRAFAEEGIGDERDDADHQGAPERGPEPRDVEALHHRAHHPEQERVDHQHEQAERVEQQRQRDDQQQRAHERVQEPQQQGRDEQRRDPVIAEPAHDVDGDEYGQRGDDPALEELHRGGGHGTDTMTEPDPLSGTSCRGFSMGVGADAEKEREQWQASPPFVGRPSRRPAGRTNEKADGFRHRP